MTANASHTSLDHIRVVLLYTSHPGNIGATCRAMATMGLTELYLVAPKKYPHPAVSEMSAGAESLVIPKVVPDIESAIGDCHLVLGTSARLRYMPVSMLSARQAGEICIERAHSHQVAIMFGPERTGMLSEWFQYCHYHVFIDGNPLYQSLNLASAVQILCYELRQAMLQGRDLDKPPLEYASMEQTQGFYRHLERLLLKIRFLNPDNPRQLLPRLMRLFNRVQLETMEINILRGILASIEKRMLSSCKQISVREHE